MKGTLAFDGLLFVDGHAGLGIYDTNRLGLQDALTWHMRRSRGLAMQENSRSLEITEGVMNGRIFGQARTYTNVMQFEGKDGNMVFGGFGFDEKGEDRFTYWNFLVKAKFKAAPVFILQTHSKKSLLKSAEWEELVEVEAGLNQGHIRTLLAVVLPQVDMILAPLKDKILFADSSAVTPLFTPLGNAAAVPDMASVAAR
jgi:hypothetical protein